MKKQTTMKQTKGAKRRASYRWGVESYKTKAALLGAVAAHCASELTDSEHALGEVWQGKKLHNLAIRAELVPSTGDERQRQKRKRAGDLPPGIYITMEGGLVQGVNYVGTQETRLGDLHVFVVDFDVEGADPEDYVTVASETSEPVSGFVSSLVLPKLGAQCDAARLVRAALDKGVPLH